MALRILLRRDVASRWSAVNPVLWMEFSLLGADTVTLGGGWA